MTHNPLESKIETRLFTGIKALGGRCEKIQKKPGFPGRLIIMPGGYYLWVELKRPSGRVAEHQDLAHGILRELGCLVELVWSYEDVDALLKRLARRERIRQITSA
jgi:hypothetical protein